MARRVCDAAGAGLVLLLSCLLPACRSSAGPAIVSGGLRLAFDDRGGVMGVAVRGKELAVTGRGGFRVVEVLPGRKRTHYGWVRGSAVMKDGSLHADLESKAARLKLPIRVTGRAKYVEVTGEIIDTTGRDRALIVSFTLPVKTAGATFENTLREHYRLTGKDEAPRGYEGTRHVGRWNALRHSNCAFTALNFGDGAVAMAFPLHAPRLVVMKATPAGYVIEFHVGLTPLTKKFPRRASFRFIIYAVDPKWGIRDAAAKYYAFFPELFQSRCAKHGNWGELPHFTDEWRGKRPEDFALQFALADVQWRDGKLYDSRAAMMRTIGCYVFHHREPWGWWHDQRDYTAKKDEKGQYPIRKQTAAQELEEIKQQAAGNLPIKEGTNQLCHCPPRLAAQAAVNSHCIHYGEMKNDGNEDLTMLRGLSWSYGCSQIAMNMDPELPKPNRAQIAEEWQFRYFFKWKDRGRTDPHGISWDSLTSWTLVRWLNFRREHFATADYPLVYSPRDGRLGALILFQDIEFAKYFSEKIHKAGGMVYVNTRMKEIFYAAPYVDAFGVESMLDHTKRYGFEELSMLRCSAHQKPVSFYKGGQTSEAGIRRGVLFGIFPGVAGVKESQRKLYKKYMPPLKAAAEAGWEPVTHATAGAENVLIERFGGNARSKNTAYLTLYNDSDRPVHAAIRVDLAALGWQPDNRPLRVHELIESRFFRSPPNPGRVLIGALTIQAREALILRVRR